MDHFGGSAVLAGIIVGLMLWSWAIGRLQRGPSTDPDCAPAGEPLRFEWNAPASASPDPVRPCQQAARDERRAALDLSASLGQIHDEVSAYRREAQVFSHMEEGEMAFTAASATETGGTCRYIGISGTPTCPRVISAKMQCARADCSRPMPSLAIRLDQPSVEPGAFTRV